MEQKIQDFKAYLDRLNTLGGIMSVLSFDSSTIAPDGGIAQRAKRMGFLELEIFKLQTSPEMKAHLDALTPHLAELDTVTAAMYNKAKKDYDRGTKIPPEKVQAYEMLATEAEGVWAKARKENDFAAFAPYLKRLIAFKKEFLELRKDEMPAGGVLYDIFLDDFEAGMTVEKYDDFFNKLKATIVPLVKKIAASKKEIVGGFAALDIDTQRKLSDILASEVGFDQNRGYIGEAAHPFCGGPDKTDVRITTRYDKDDLFSSFYGIMHECGHAIYEQNISDDIADTILGTGTSMGMHESQSRFYENVIGRSLPFWQYISPKLKEILPAEFGSVTPQMFYEWTNRSEASLIRVEADELTYGLHIVIRYEIEKMIFSGQVEVEDLPKLWNQKYEEYLGLTPPTDANGVMQDIHWSIGLMGYFPTYALGSAYAAQFLYYMRKEMDVDALIKKGDIAAITNWLKEKIHKHGKVYTPNQLMEMNFGEQLNGEHFAKYLEEKYSELYGL